MTHLTCLTREEAGTIAYARSGARQGQIARAFAKLEAERASKKTFADRIASGDAT